MQVQKSVILASNTLTLPQTTIHMDLHLALHVQNANGAADYTGADFVNDLLMLVNEKHCSSCPDIVA
jgi:hypothetical protein